MKVAIDDVNNTMIYYEEQNTCADIEHRMALLVECHLRSSHLSNFSSLRLSRYLSSIASQTLSSSDKAFISASNEERPSMPFVNPMKDRKWEDNSPYICIRTLITFSEG